MQPVPHLVPAFCVFGLVDPDAEQEARTAAERDVEGDGEAGRGGRVRVGGDEGEERGRGGEDGRGAQD